MRIGIDVRYLSHGLLGGVHTYVYNIITALARLTTDDEFVLYCDTKQPFEIAALPPNFRLRMLPWRSKLDSLKTDFRLSHYAAQDRLDLMHYPANYGFGPVGVPTLITLHDALNIFPLWEATSRDLMRPKTLALTLYLQAMTRLSLRQAARLVTVSHYAADDIVRVSRGAIRRETIHVVYSGVGREYTPIRDTPTLDAVRQRLGVAGRFVLADGLKNPGVIVRAWQHLPQSLRDEVQIVFFSRRADLLPVALEAIRNGQARHVLRPSQDDLIALYTMAELFLFPSWIEGFGLPMLEAMACGTRVIASDRGSLPEVGSDAALYHDAEDAVTLGRLVTNVLTSPAQQRLLRERGLRRAAEFDWDRTARELHTLYRSVAWPVALVGTVR